MAVSQEHRSGWSRKSGGSLALTRLSVGGNAQGAVWDAPDQTKNLAVCRLTSSPSRLVDVYRRLTIWPDETVLGVQTAAVEMRLVFFPGPAFLAIAREYCA
jgi:hypothetical protein